MQLYAFLFLLFHQTFLSTVLAVRLRLTRGTNSWSGMLEVYYDNRWGTVCDDEWSTTNTGVACRDMGYHGGQSWSGSHPKYGLTVWLDDVKCTGRETRLEQCSHKSWGSNNCGNENVYIICVPNMCEAHPTLCGRGTCIPHGQTNYTCECPPQANGPRCQQDVNECEDARLNECSHECTNLLIDGYACSCPDQGLELGPDNRTCITPHAGVSCAGDVMAVHLSKTGLAGVRAEYLQLDGAGPGCEPRDSQSLVTFNIPIDQCGTTRRVVDDELLYENHIISKAVSVSGVVSPVRKVNITVRCRYPRTVHVHDLYHVHTEQLNFSQDQDGQFPVSLTLEQGGRAYTAGGMALVADPGSELRVRVRLEPVHPDLALSARHCLATPGADASGPGPQYSLLKDGCAMDSTLQLSRNQTEELLTLQAFKFVGPYDTVFLHCDVTVCNASDVTSLCHQGCTPAVGPNVTSAGLASQRVSLGPVHIRSLVQDDEQKKN